MINKDKGGDEMATLICWLICAYIGYEIAKSKGRDPWVWAIICFFFAVLGVILVAILPSVKDNK